MNHIGIIYYFEYILRFINTISNVIFIYIVLGKLSKLNQLRFQINNRDPIFRKNFNLTWSFELGL